MKNNSMIICSVCQLGNDQYSTVCKKCGGFLQNRVTNLDLFNTIWEIIENPKNAFKLITMAEHKNYALLLFVLVGIRISFAGIWYFKLGNQFDNLLSIILWTILIGIPLGIVLSFFYSVLHLILCKIFDGKTSFRCSFGITSYAFTPIIISLFIVMPIQLMTFGMFLFTYNPPPMTIKPISYMTLMGFDILLLAWAFLLSIMGTHIGAQIPVWKSVIITLVFFLLIIGFLIIGNKYILKGFYTHLF